MLGHIAIATMGGCFSQNPDTGECEATYFPADYVDICQNFSHAVARDAGTTDFTLGFTQTRFWTKQQYFSVQVYRYPAFVSLGTRSAAFGARTWVQCGVGPFLQDAVEHIVNENIYNISTILTPTRIWTCRKEAGTNTSVMTDGELTSTKVTGNQSTSLGNVPFEFRTGIDTPEGHHVRFWGDLMHNEPYHVRFRRMPMQCAEYTATALYDADGKQLVEY